MRKILRGLDWLLDKLWIPVCIAAIAGTLASCGTVLPYTPVVVVPMSGLYGATNCDQNGNPIVMIDPDSLRTTRMHEQQHVKDMLAYPGGCRAFLARYKAEPAFRVNMELRAYCVEFHAGRDVSGPLLMLATTKGLPENYVISNVCQSTQSEVVLSP